MASTMDKKNKLARLQKKESNLVYKGKKAVDEGREKKADRLLGRAAKVENRVIKTSKKMQSGGSVKTKKNNIIMKTPKKSTVKKGYAPNQGVATYSGSKSKYTGTDSKGKVDWISNYDTKSGDKRYEALGKPTYQTTKNYLEKTPDFKKSMDTIGYAAGKKEFTVNSITRSPGKLTTTKSAKVPRSAVNKTLDKWKASANDMGGSKTKKTPKAQKGGPVDLEKKEKALNAGPGVRLAPEGSANRAEQERRAKKRLEQLGTNTRNQESMANQAMRTRLFDKNTVANQQFDNSKRAFRHNFKDSYNTALTNKWKTDALNQMYANYQVDPRSGGKVFYNPTEKALNNTKDGMTDLKFADSIKSYDAIDRAAMWKNRLAKKHGGQVFKQGGFVYTVFPTND